MLEEALTEKCTSPDKSFTYLMPIRQKLGLPDEEHYQILSIISSESPEIVYPQQSENSTKTQTLHTKLKKPLERPNSSSEQTQLRRKNR